MKNLPNEYVFEPWLAPIDMQKNAGCVVGSDYPKCVIDAEMARKICTERMREVFCGLVSKGRCDVENLTVIGKTIINHHNC